jgi:hypothetical protein
VLTVITGKNIAKRTSPSVRKGSEAVVGGPGRGLSSEVSMSENQPYTLSAEIQSILIEDFLPPISSSTAPGNPGRLYVTLPIPKAGDVVKNTRPTR